MHNSHWFMLNVKLLVLAKCQGTSQHTLRSIRSEGSWESWYRDSKETDVCVCVCLYIYIIILYCIMFISYSEKSRGHEQRCSASLKQVVFMLRLDSLANAILLFAFQSLRCRICDQVLCALHSTTHRNGLYLIRNQATGRQKCQSKWSPKANANLKRSPMFSPRGSLVLLSPIQNTLSFKNI